MTTFPLAIDKYNAGRALADGTLAEDMNALHVIAASGGGVRMGYTAINSVDDFPVSVGGVRTLLPNWVYEMRNPVDIGDSGFEGNNVTLLGNAAQQTLISSSSTRPLMKSNGPGYIVFDSCALANSVGPLMDLDTGTGFLATVVMGACFVNCGNAGQLGIIRSAARVNISNTLFVNFTAGLQLDGIIDEFSVNSSAFEASAVGPVSKAIAVLPTCTLDSGLLQTVRFQTMRAGDCAVDFDLAATYISPLEILGSTHRGPGLFLSAGGMNKDDPRMMTIGNTGVLDSYTYGEMRLSGNLVETVVSGLNAFVTPGTGNPGTHDLHVLSPFEERVALEGVTADVQSLRVTDTRLALRSITLIAVLNKVGGGTPDLSVQLYVNGDLVPSSLMTQQVPGSGATFVTTGACLLVDGDLVTYRVANQTTTNNIVVRYSDLRVGSPPS